MSIGGRAPCADLVEVGARSFACRSAAPCLGVDAGEGASAARRATASGASRAETLAVAIAAGVGRSGVVVEIVVPDVGIADGLCGTRGAGRAIGDFAPREPSRMSAALIRRRAAAATNHALLVR